jgi:alanyl-tRNA synthetase
MELCGGTHTHRTGDVGLFKIVSESAVGANVRRIEALTGKAALEYVQSQELEIKEASALLKTSPEQLRERIDKLLKEQRQKDGRSSSKSDSSPPSLKISWPVSKRSKGPGSWSAKCRLTPQRT